MALHDLSVADQLALLARGELTPRALSEHYLARIAALDHDAAERPGVGAFTVITADAALRRADALDRERRHGALWGLPHADKDLVARAGVPTRRGSRLFADAVPTASDELALALDDADAISLGKTSTSEFGLTGYTEPLAGRPARDPWDLSRGAGGSSGGAAAAVAAGLLPATIGSDGGGSVRIPAATVGVVGLKPSRGRLPMGSGLDSPGGLAVHGPLARSVDDAAILLDALVGARPYRYATGAPAHAGSFRPVEEARGLRVGVTTVSPWDDAEDITLDADAAAAVSIAADALSAEHGVDGFDWRPFGYADLFRTLWRVSAARIPLTEEGLATVEPATAWLIREGRELPADAVLGALTAATAFERRTIADFERFNAVLTPALAQSPRPVGWYDRDNPERGFAQQVEYAPYSSFVNVAGLPALVVPVTTATDGHPVSVQLVGRPGGEAALLQLGAVLERARGPLPHPPLW